MAVNLGHTAAAAGYHARNLMRRRTAVRWAASISSVGSVWLASVPGAAAAPPARVAIEWTAPEGCATREDVEHRVAALLAGSSTVPEGLVIRAHVAHTAAVWSVTLETQQGARTGKREIRAESCEALADAAALVVAMSIDPDTVLQNRSAATAPEPTPPPASPPPPPPRPRPPPPAPTGPAHRTANAPDRHHQKAHREPEHWAVGIAAAVDLGRLPRPAFGEEARVAALWGHLRAELGASVWVPQDARIAGHPGAGGHFRLVAGRARGCYRFGEHALDVAGCAGADLSWISAEGLGVRTPARGNQWLVSPALGVELEWRAFGPIGLFVSADLSVPVGIRPFVIDGVSIHRPGSVTGAGSLGAEVHF